jgi:hypothetical protein
MFPLSLILLFLYIFLFLIDFYWLFHVLSEISSFPSVDPASHSHTAKLSSTNFPAFYATAAELADPHLFPSLSSDFLFSSSDFFSSLGLSPEPPVIGFEVLNYCDYSDHCKQVKLWKESEPESWQNDQHLTKVLCNVTVASYQVENSHWNSIDSFPLSTDSFTWRCPQLNNKQTEIQLYRVSLQCEQLLSSGLSESLYVLPNSCYVFCNPPLFTINRSNTFLLFKLLTQQNIIYHWRTRMEALKALEQAEKREKINEKQKLFVALRLWMNQSGWQLTDFAIFFALLISFIVPFLLFSLWRIQTLNKQIETKLVRKISYKLQQ